MRAKNNIDIVAMIAFVLTCSACGNKERANEFGIVEDHEHGFAVALDVARIFEEWQ